MQLTYRKFVDKKNSYISSGLRTRNLHCYFYELFIIDVHISVQMDIRAFYSIYTLIFSALIC